MVLFTAIVVVGTLTFLFILFSKWRYQYWSRKGVSQLEPQLIFGDYKPIITGSVAGPDYLLKIYRDAKAKGLKQIGLYNFTKPEWMVLDLNIIKHVLLKDFDSFSSHGLYSHENEPISVHLFALEGQKWKTRRSKLSPTFTTGKMKMMFETVTEKTNLLKKIVGKHAEFDKEIRTKETLARFGTDVIGSVAFGIECNTLEEQTHKFRAIGKKAFEPKLSRVILEEFIPHNILGKLGYLNQPKEVTDYFTQIVQETIKYRETNNVQRKDFMQLMLQLKNQGDKGNYLTENEILSESFLIYLAGFETSSSATTFALLELSQNQDIQDKLRQEIYDSLEQNGGDISYDVIMQMPYLGKIMQETLRKYPVLPFLPRKCTKTYRVPGTNVVLDKGTRVHIPVWGIHLDPEYYPNPEVFNPENFSPENKAKRPDFTWMPFGEGPRMCIGLRFGMMQSKMALITLIKDFRFSPHEKTKWPLELEEGTVVMTAKGDLWLKIEKL